MTLFLVNYPVIGFYLVIGLALSVVTMGLCWVTEMTDEN